jgi:asparagine synthase (glutamine-hydrolysing)
VVNKERLAGRHPVHRRSYLDVKLRLADHLLSEHGDRMVLANSVEGRYPFLDVELVEFARTVPPELKISGFTEKHIVKLVARDLLPKQVIEREKFGFRAPGTPFLLRQGIDWIEDHLSYDHVTGQGVFNPDTIAALRRRYREPGFDFNPHIETDFLMVALTFSLLCELFDLRTL